MGKKLPRGREGHSQERSKQSESASSTTKLYEGGMISRVEEIGKSSGGGEIISRIDKGKLGGK